MTTMTETGAPADLSDVRTLTISWSVSRGRETYGYNICRLDDTATGKRYRCNGGGYDMVGTVFGEWLQEVAQDRLRAISDQAYTRWTEPADGGSWAQERNAGGLYGMSYYTHDGRVVLDGACGIESMRRIAEAVGIATRAIVSRKGSVTGYTVSGV